MKKRYLEWLKVAARLASPSLRRLVRNYVPATEYDLYLAQQADPYSNEEDTWLVSGSKYKLGIIKEFAHYHKYYICACRELGISYQLLDLSKNDWINIVQQSNCDAFLVWPSASLSVWKAMFDERMYCLAHEMGKIVYPSWEEIWLYENKRRVSYWLDAHNIPHPQTWVFYDRDEALEFVREWAFPLVLKTNTGAAASGVYILKTRSEAEALVRRAFSKGVVARRHNPNDRHWGYVLLQEYIDIKREWRMVRIGDSFFGHPKGRRGNFHSGSGIALWDVPPRELLDFTRKVTETGNFSSMDVDVFETQEGEYLVNELQTVFGASYSVDQLRVDGKAGRFLHDEAANTWVFEEGNFARNACANARVTFLVNQILPHRKTMEKDCK